MKIRTNFDYPPIPIRSMDWSAVYDDYDGAEDGHCPMGHGRTEAEAVLDLIDNAPRYPDCCLTLTPAERDAYDRL
jgi:hypothetical protein